MNKYNIKSSLGALLIATTFLLAGCPSPPEFPVEPSIAFQDISFEQFPVEGLPNVTEDVISVTIAFEDGNGDLGLSSNDINGPYEEFSIPLDEQRVPFFIGQNDTLPSYNTQDYLVIREDDTTIVGNAVLAGDTIFIVRNERYYNIFIKMFYQPGGSDEFVEYLWPDNQTFHGRFPILNTEDYQRPLNGELTYEIKSSQFQSVFRADPLKIETYILDRAGNRSNTIQTDAIALITFD